jgi:APA family basic amino acid/polyamine antiporter
MAQDGKFFKALAQIHPRTGTPVNAIVLQSAWAVVLLLVWGQFEKVITSVVFLDWVFMIVAALSIFYFRKTSDSLSGFKTPLYPIVPLIFIGVSVWFVVYTLIGRPEQALWALGLLILGLPIYFLAQRR